MVGDNDACVIVEHTLQQAEEPLTKNDVRSTFYHSSVVILFMVFIALIP